MKKITTFLSLSFLLFFLFWGFKTEAVNLSEVVVDIENLPGANDNIIAQVDVRNPEILAREGRKLKIGFSIENSGEEVQPQVKYSVVLEEITEAEYQQDDITVSYPVDEKVFDEVLSLNPGQSLSREIDYTIPDNFSGDYLIMIYAQNENGLLFSLVPAGRVSLQEIKDTVLIDELSCFLQVVGEDKKYLLNQGVDVDFEEELVAKCDIKNRFNQDIKLIPKFFIYKRTTSGEVLSQEEGSEVFLQEGNNDQVEIPVPIMEKAQAYDTKLGLYDADSNLVSNFVKIRYVTRGSSATIQNVRLDKDYYEAGDTANISLEMTGRADFFPNSRFFGSDPWEASAKYAELVSNLVLDSEIISGKGDLCGKVNNQPVEYGNFSLDFGIPIENKCKDPRIVLAIKDKDGQILDKMTFDVETKSQQNFSDWFNKYTIAIFLIIVILLTVKFKVFNHKTLILLFVLFANALLFTPQTTSAVTVGSLTDPTWRVALCVPKTGYTYNNYQVCLGSNTWSYCQTTMCQNQGYGSFIVSSTNKSTYNCTESGYVSTTLRNFSCANGSTQGHYYVAGVWKASCVAATGGFQCSATHTKWFDPGSPGSRSINVAVKHIVDSSGYSQYNSANLPYVVSECPVNGDCGTRNAQRDGSYLNTETWWPSGSTWCKTGDAGNLPSGFPAPGQTAWWSCFPRNGGTGDTCSASRASAEIGSCGTKDGTYTYDETDYSVGSTWCGSGTATNASPSFKFPDQDEMVTWTCQSIPSGYGSDNCSAYRDPAPTVGCGSRNSYRSGSYNYTETAWPVGSGWCEFGSIDGTGPAFPEWNDIVSWDCVDGLDSVTCEAERSGPDGTIDGCPAGTCDVTCGSLEGSYSYETSGWPAGEWCLIESTEIDPDPNPVSFPGIGSVSNWLCQMGLGSANCSASRSAVPTVDGECGVNEREYTLDETDWQDDINGWCNSGLPDSSPSFPAEGDTAYWSCEGSLSTDNCSAFHSTEGCGDGVCSVDEKDSCFVDCCGDSLCESNENFLNCPVDCDADVIEF